MISHEYRVIFVHIPKAAGTSVEAALGHHGERGVSPGVQDHRTLRQLQWPRGGARQLATIGNAHEAVRAMKSRVRPDPHPANRLTVTRAQYLAYVKFGVVRNPWARTYSWYHNVRADPQHQRRLGVPPDISFPAFVAQHAGSGMLRPQTDWLIDFAGRIGVDTVCRFEALDDDYARVCRLAGLPDAPLPRLNLGDEGAYVDHFDDRSRRIVADRHRVEIELFGYTFDN